MQNQTPTETFRINLRSLSEAQRHSTHEIARISKVPQRTVSRILNGDQDKISLEQADKLAKAYGLEGWQMMIPQALLGCITTQSIRQLLDAYVSASDEGRELIKMIAERETRRASNT